MVAPTDNRMPLRNCHHIADNLLRQTCKSVTRKLLALEHLLRKSLLLKLEALNKKDRERRRKPDLKNNLESYVYATKEKKSLSKLNIDFAQPFDGRVKSLHPNIHCGILARRDVEHHMEALNEHGIGTFDGNLLWNRTLPHPSPIRPERLDVSDNPTAKQNPAFSGVHREVSFLTLPPLLHHIGELRLLQDPFFICSDSDVSAL
ncbi:unnamed protein product [Brassica napus]|uniref:(rape) hypothetical protein n=1 Tax=Brassica napus TaxID=3708 RepID=A0A816XP03_BRANA|nr:unnamed protein product [Brassica napus]